MLSEEKLVDIVKDEAENLIRKGETSYKFYYILLDGKMYPQDDYDKEVAEGKRSAKDIYALVGVWPPSDLNVFLFHIDYLDISSVKNIIDAYLRKIGFTITSEHKLPPTPNLKYFINAVVKSTPEYYLGIEIYDIDSIARTLHIPQIVEQKLGNKPREIKEYELSDIESIVIINQPLLAGHTYYDALLILYYYHVRHKEDYKDEAYKVAFAYMNLFPEPYRTCYEWKAGIFVKIDCLKIVVHSF